MNCLGPTAIHGSENTTEAARSAPVGWLFLTGGTTCGGGEREREEGENQHQRASALSWSSTAFVKALAVDRRRPDAAPEERAETRGSNQSSTRLRVRGSAHGRREAQEKSLRDWPGLAFFHSDLSPHIKQSAR